MESVGDSAGELLSGLHPPHHGYGPLLERDYWAVIEHCHLKPSEVLALVALKFPEFSPSSLAKFKKLGDAQHRPLQRGDELEVAIRGAGTFGVRVLHRNATSLTLGTLKGHPEAGRITFGAYRNDRGDVIFHIRSRARSGSRPHLLGFLAAGDAMQTNTWTEFVNRVAVTVGEGVVGFIYADKRKIEDEPDDPEVHSSPTYIAEAD